ncbi:heterokaryon incompatibility protein-domain-containing protein [Xylariales sp. AK1849]|nr:heterokaryon incompatibility protein-domain-containing protein [Xylariales sp. AK1849]
MTSADSAPIHSKLNGSIREIRLLQILGADDDSLPVCCTMTTASLDQPPIFVALSYCWGDPSITEPITVNGVPINVTSNLAAALCRLRTDVNTLNRNIWIDAICINQHSNEEKNQQVPLMRDIYASAINVVVWLGESDRWVDKFAKLMSVIPSSDLEDLDTQQRDDHYSKPWRIRFILLAVHFFSRPWFSRIWIVQEVVVPKADPRVLCGAHDWHLSQILKVIDFVHVCITKSGVYWEGGNLQRVPQRYFSELGFTKESSSEPQSMWSDTSWSINSHNTHAIDELRRYRWQLSKAMDFPSLLYKSRFALATNSRDKVFGLMGLVSDSDEPFKQVIDYNLEPSDVFFRTAKVCLSMGHFGVYSLIAESWERLPSSENMPSWVFDLSRPRHVQDSELPRYSRWLGTQNKAKLDATGRLLVVPGTSIDRIRYCSRILAGQAISARNPAAREEVDRMRDLWVAFKEARSYDSPETATIGHQLREQRCREKSWEILALARMGENFSITPFFDRPSGEIEELVDKGLCEGWAAKIVDRLAASAAEKVSAPALFKELHEAHTKESKGDWPTEDVFKVVWGFITEVWAQMSGRCYFTTNGGFVGWSRVSQFQEGDHIALLHGTIWPTVLRPQSDGCYSYGGSAYVSGLMDYKEVKPLYRAGVVKNRTYRIC